MAEEYHDGDDMFDEVSRPSISFKDQPYGFFYEGVVIDAPKKVQSRDFETGNLAYWDDGQPKMSVVVGIKVTACSDPAQVGEERSIWVAKGSNMYSAVAAAQRAGGGRVRKGGTIRVTFDSERPNEKNPKLNQIKQYVVTWTEPDGFAEPDSTPAPAAPAAPQAAPPAMTKPTTPIPAAAAAPPAAAPEVLMDQIRTLIRTGMTDVQIAGVPSIHAAGVTAEAVQAVRNELGAAV